MRHPLTAIFGTERHLVQIYSAIARISSDLVEISSEPVEISSELVRISSEPVSTILELLITSTFRITPKSDCAPPVSPRIQRRSQCPHFIFIQNFVKIATHRTSGQFTSGTANLAHGLNADGSQTNESKLPL